MIEIRIAPSRRRMRFRKTRKESQTGVRLGGGAVTDIIFVDAGFPHPGGLKIDDFRIDLAQVLVAETPSIHLARTEILADGIRLAHHRFQQIASFRMVQIERDTEFARIGVVEVRAAIEISRLRSSLSRTLSTPAVRRRMIGYERLHVSDKV